jgi:hypothetical protein
MAIQYASLEEAWGDASVVQQHPVDDSFNVSKSDVRQRAPYAGLQDDVTMALESAYPTDHGAAHRLPRTAAHIAHHSDNSAPCAMDDEDIMNATFAAQYDASGEGVDSAPPTSMFANSVTDTGPRDCLPRRREHGGHGEHTNAHKRVHAIVPAIGASATERMALYDILVFVLFGLLMVLALHEAASLGEMIGRTVR